MRMKGISVRMDRGALVVGLIGLVLILAACAAGANPEVGSPPAAGFLLGLWHGFISPITFLISLFNDNVSIYEVHNDGNWYDFGFVLGAGILFGGFFRAGRSGRHR
jgi:hypothetical protein